MSDQGTELHKIHRQGQEKYVYFLLAAAGAAIGFAVTQTKSDALSWAHLPLGAAVVSWALSFYLGCSRLWWVDAGIYTNAALLQVRRGAHPDVGSHPEKMAIATDVLRGIFNKQTDRAAWRGRWQFRLLILGAGFYILWHVLEMYLRRS